MTTAIELKALHQTKEVSEYLRWYTEFVEPNGVVYSGWHKGFNSKNWDTTWIPNNHSSTEVTVSISRTTSAGSRVTVFFDRIKSKYTVSNWSGNRMIHHNNDLLYGIDEEEANLIADYVAKWSGDGWGNMMFTQERLKAERELLDSCGAGGTHTLI